MNAVIQVSDLEIEKRLNGVSVNAQKGDCIHVIGPNGAGKSTLMTAIAGLVSPDSGRITFKGKPLEYWSLAELASMRTVLAQHLELSFALSVSEYLSFYSISENLIIPSMLETALEIATFLNKPITQLSGGERQRVEICRALLQIWPQLLKGEGIAILDEPLQGLDIRHQYAVATLVQTLCSKGNTVIMSSHDIGLSVNYCSQLWLMQQGNIVASGSPSKVATQFNLEKVFECHFSVNQKNNFLEIQVCAPITLE